MSQKPLTDFLKPKKVNRNKLISTAKPISKLWSVAKEVYLVNCEWVKDIIGSIYILFTYYKYKICQVREGYNKKNLLIYNFKNLFLITLKPFFCKPWWDKKYEKQSMLDNSSTTPTAACGKWSDCKPSELGFPLK